jgi:alcohol dehydrogenase
MLLGAHLAGAAIENSMLGAAHACANPLTSKFGITHGVAVGLMLPHVIRFNDPNAEALACRIEGMLDVVRFPRRLVEHGVTEAAIPELAEMASQQWTAKFNPRPVDAAALQNIYTAAL